MAQTEQPLQEARILIVDDKEIVVKVITRILRHAGFSSVSATTDPSSVLELCERQPPDLLILDLVMPGMDGADLLDALRPAERRPRPLAVLILSGEGGGSELLERARAAGAAAVLEKTFDRAQLVAAVCDVLAGSPSRGPAVP